jgi:gamma-glutamylcyclotransferase (GGCT)/AIG2-like uncharacterized protein YtfP
MLYFAYGSNLNSQAMLARCPHSKPLGLARLAKHRIFIMEDGYASIRPDPRAFVHGVLYDLAFSDVHALDRYEEVSRGLYRKINQPVLRAAGAPVRAMVYLGRSLNEGRPSPDYWQPILAAATGWGLPRPYISMLEALGGLETQQPEPGARRAIKLKGI